MTEQMLVDATVGLGFERYVQRVAVGVGAGIEQWCCRREHPLEAYIALDRTVPRFPGREVALLWEETCGWALAVETRSGEDLIVLGYLGEHAVPTPDAVADFAATLGTRLNSIEVRSAQLTTSRMGSRTGVAAASTAGSSMSLKTM